MIFVGKTRDKLNVKPWLYKLIREWIWISVYSCCASFGDRITWILVCTARNYAVSVQALSTLQRMLTLHALYVHALLAL
jgi:hypothetical protein